MFVHKKLTFATLLVSASVVVVGCRSRDDFYCQADADAYGLIDDKSAGTPWEVPLDYSVEPDPRSRHYLPGCRSCPPLPGPVTPLYSYDLSAIRSTVRTEPENPLDSQTQGQNPEDDELRGVAISPDAWEAIPESCLKRMLDFATIREEVEFTEQEFGRAIDVERDLDIPRLTLREIVDIAIINSRDYLTQKENLYLTSLSLAQERFQYQYRLSSNGFGTGLNYDHNRSGGTTVNGVSLPTGVRTEKMLVTGGDLFASFANSILLTFNGPSGFSADISSDILLQISQPLIQTDVRFESLTQAERNLVYAARDFARFRKQFFVDFASRYYDLIRTFRQIEINSQNYFSLVREFKRAEAEYQTGAVSRVQVDQVEQNLLSGRGSLISTCVGVEQSLDGLKLALGIPVETPINVDLTELNALTRSDQVSVSADSINRILLRLKNALQTPNRIELASTTAVLLERVIDSVTINPNYESDDRVIDYQVKRFSYLIKYARLIAQVIYAELQNEVNSPSPSPTLIFRRSQSHSEALLNLITQHINFSQLKAADGDQARIDEFENKRQQLSESVDKLEARFSVIIQEEGLDELPDLVESSNELREQIQSVVAELDVFNEISVEDDPAADLEKMKTDIRQLIEELQPLITAQLAGLTPIDIDQDEAMITALVLRFDLMNQRGSLADDWRQIKLAADELKSVINLDASQRISTDPSTNDPFNFSFDDSQTSLSLQIDAPVNRFAQRNTFRSTLIGYQRALRSLNQLEDNIKFSIRNDLRSLALDRQQYLIAVASAALAYERVVSTSIQFRLGIEEVAARDFLEAQTAYINALSDVASRHIDYIVDRTQLFLDLELLAVDESGFWNDLTDESVKPEAYFAIPPWGQPIYGELPCVNYSCEIQQMLCVPPDFELGIGLPDIDELENLNNESNQDEGQPIIKLAPPNNEVEAGVTYNIK